MKNIIRHISMLFTAVLIVAGCNIWSDYDPNGIVSELTISVAVSDTPGSPMTRAYDTRAEINPGDYISPAHAGEMIQTLRIMILRPGTIDDKNKDTTWVVEHNRYMDFYGVSKKAYMEVNGLSFKVYGPEWKKVYLFVNENTTKTAVDGQTQVKLVNYDFDSLAPGDEFSMQTIDNLKIILNEESEEVPSYALPMSECHNVKMPATDYHRDLFVTRAATKFTYIFDNQTSQQFNLTEIIINKGSRVEYYMPRITYNGDPLKGTFDVKDYLVPNVDNNDYYSFRKDYTTTIAASGVTTLESIYLLEGKYTNVNDTRNYSMSVTLDETVYEEHFPDVPQLPRNTHVVVVITLGEHGIDWTVDVCPYGEYWLYPDFGI